MTSLDNDPTQLTADELREAVRDRYATAARQATQALDDATPPSSSCCGPATSCCGGTTTTTTTIASPVGNDPITRDLYGDEAEQVSSGALAASLGCGNPTLLADLRPGQTVLDLGSGGGLDVLLSAKRVGPTGKAYGLDMTPEMLALARRNQAEAGVENAEFLAGTIEDIPLPDASVDVLISNCVINLAADKDAVLREAFRVLRPGGRFAVSDIVLLKPLPEPAQRAMRLWTGCVAGALVDTDYVAKLAATGFTDAAVEITRRYERTDLDDLAADLKPEDVPADLDLAAVLHEMDGATASAFVRATKPA
ncbi:MAG TPA: arsenite methyltransferase [Kineosporiaceae bacterium]|jgi:arsenite methyltransferase|nr:arsenite methyltransferase [Kineosporiaceae bacterium]